MPQNPSFEEMTRLPIVCSIPGMDRTAVRRDVVYKTASETLGHDQAPLLMDIYSPGGGEQTRLPAVVLIHGGPVPNARPKDWGMFTSYGRLLAASGFVAVTFNHRFSGPERLLDAAADVDGAIAHVRANADGLGIDPDRIGLWAFSGGGPFLSAAMRDRPPFVRALVAFYAILDLRAKPPGATPAVTDEMRRDFSPLVHLGAEGIGMAPIFIARAGLDHPLLNGPMDRFVQEALARNLTLDVMNHATGRHGFDILDDDARSREIIARTLDFLKARLQE
ncbi:MAG TPA: alpha/beta hydrolase [Thermoanaerobaculia bacterium]|nr:alpha/beta hydrolase [Thermoanaerobaculia bacterium]